MAKSAPMSFVAVGVVLGALSISLQGCSIAIPRHTLGNWQAKQNYLVEYRTPRKSQTTAFALSIFLGVFGIDQFYLGFPWYGFFKLISGGGCGLWYMYDIMRIGSTPVTTGSSYRVAHNVSHAAFVVVMVAVTLTIGFFLSMISIRVERLRKAREMMLLKMETGGLDSNAFESVDEGKGFAFAPGVGAGYSQSPGFAQSGGYVSYAQTGVGPSANMRGVCGSAAPAQVGTYGVGGSRTFFGPMTRADGTGTPRSGQQIGFQPAGAPFTGYGTTLAAGSFAG